MTERLRIGERTHERSVSSGSEDRPLRVDIDGRSHEVDVSSSGGGRHCVLIDGKIETLFTARSPEGVWVWWKGHSWLVADAEREARRVSSRAGTGTSAGVAPSTPAVVTAIMVRTGDDVAAGQTLVVVTAMKMETCLVAEFAGRVRAINTAVGAKVRPGEILVEIERRDIGPS